MPNTRGKTPIVLEREVSLKQIDLDTSESYPCIDWSESIDKSILQMISQ